MILRDILYTCGVSSCDRQWEDPMVEHPDRTGFCPFCGSPMYTFVVVGFHTVADDEELAA